MASEKITVTVPEEIVAAAKASAGKNLSAYVTRALRNQVTREAMIQLSLDLQNNPALAADHDAFLTEAEAEQENVAAALDSSRGRAA